MEVRELRDKTGSGEGKTLTFGGINTPKMGLKPLETWPDKGKMLV